MKKLFTKTTTFIKKHPKLDIAVLITGIVIFATIALFNVTNASIWFDEAFSAYIIQFSFWDIARYTATDVHPPFYYWVLKTWTLLFGTTDLAIRSMSIFFGSAVIAATFFLTRKMFSRSVAWVSLLFLILSPMLIRYSDEARMYTLAAFIVILATYVLLKATELKQRKLWVYYGLLVSIGMWTHYFTAFAWLAHWVWRATQTWRKGDKLKAVWRKFFTKDWVIAYAIAVGVFLPWLIVMGYQLTVVQASGFWISPVSIDTPANYLSNYFYYLEHYEAQSWLAFALIGIIILTIVLLPKAYAALKAGEKKSFLLISSLAWAPPVLLFLASLPPLRPSFVERYLLPAIIALSVFLAVVLVVGTRRWKAIYRAIPVAVISAMMIFGITNVYYYGNFNKNTMYHIMTKEVVQEIQRLGEPGQPIVSQTPWVFYEAIQYTSKDHPVFFVDETTEYVFGSLDMLKDNDRNKIKDFDAFAKANPVIWYIGQNESGDISPLRDDWKKLQSVGIKDEITGKTIYRATQYVIN